MRPRRTKREPRPLAVESKKSSETTTEPFRCQQLEGFITDRDIEGIRAYITNQREPDENRMEAAFYLLLFNGEQASLQIDDQNFILRFIEKLVRERKISRAVRFGSQLATLHPERAEEVRALIPEKEYRQSLDPVARYVDPEMIAGLTILFPDRKYAEQLTREQRESLEESIRFEGHIATLMYVEKAPLLRLSGYSASEVVMTQDWQRVERFIAFVREKGDHLKMAKILGGIRVAMAPLVRVSTSSEIEVFQPGAAADMSLPDRSAV